MARLVSQVLLRHCKSPPPLIPFSTHHRHRHRSSSNQPQLIEIDLSSSPSSESEEDGNFRSRNVEEIMNNVMIQELAPDWLPFIPGSSFWIPPNGGSSSKFDVAVKYVKVKRPEQLGETDDAKVEVIIMENENSEDEQG